MKTNSQIEERQFQTKVGTINYLDSQIGEIPILFIHGLGCSGFYDYSPIVMSNCLSGHRKIIVDLLGTGNSSKPKHFYYSMNNHAELLYDFITFLGIETLIVYGHSMGGSIAINLVEKLKEKVVSLILSEANLDNGGGIFSQQIAAFSLTEFEACGFQEIINKSYTTGNDIWAKTLSNTLPKAVHDEAISLVKGQHPSWREIFYSLRCNKTFIFGEKSLPDKDFRILAQNHIKIEVVKNAGHSMAWENAEGLAKAIANGIAL